MSTVCVQDKVWWGGVVMCCVAIAACEPREAQVDAPPSVRQGRVLAHVSQPKLERHLDAYVYGDISGATQTHIASTMQNTWCTSRSFMSLFDRLQRSKDDAACEQVAAVTSDAGALATLKDEELLMMQTMRFVCEQPEATCQTYSEHVYRSTLEQTPYWTGRLERYEIRTMTEQEGGEVKAYIDLYFPEPVGVRREFVVMRRVGEASDEWRVQRGLEAL